MRVFIFQASVAFRIGALAALLLAPLPALAATISSVSIVKNGGNTADFFDDVGDVATAVQSTVGVNSSSSSAFETRYAAVVSADRGGGSSSGTTTQSFTGNFSITFNVTETAGVGWDIALEVMRVGAQTIVSDGSGNAAVALGALTGGESGAGSFSSGTQSLAALATLNNASTGGTPSQNSPFSQTANAVLSGVGTGFAQAVTLNYTFNASATTVDPNGGVEQGDEAALRMGINSALTQFSADDYPGTGGRVIVGDGIFLRAFFIVSPEPDTAMLLGLGIGVLAWRARRP